MAASPDLAEEGLRIVHGADEAGILLRLAGSAAFAVHSPSARALYERSGRRLVDIDLVVSGKVKAGALDELMSSLGYAPLSHHNVWHGDTRQMYERPDGVHVDVFRDEFRFCHPISLKRRLEADHPTIPLPELLLQKLQIVAIEEKDLQDATVLLLDHALGEGEDELDAGLLARTLAGDWGFWYTATTNLEKVREQLGRSALGDAERERVAGRVAELLERIEVEPKSGRWKVRARIGTRKRWYEEVEEAHR